MPHSPMKKHLSNQILSRSYAQHPPSSSKAESLRRYYQFQALGHPLDRVNVLGTNGRDGYTGCVNALSWAQDGELLLSGGDDTTVRIWKLDQNNITQEYPFVSRAVIRTGHRGNIFSAKMLPRSSRIATAARDTQIRVFDVKAALPLAITSDHVETEYSTAQTCIAIIRCHSDAVKKIVTEDSPDLFLSVSEDGTVRQHDLRTHHDCSEERCPTPLVSMRQELTSLSVSSLFPYQFVVAGESPYGYLYDRRHLRSKIEHEWGAVPRAGEEATTCVRRLGRQRSGRRSFLREHITGARISASNGHEVILSYSGDGVYLFSTKDDPSLNSSSSSVPSLLSPNAETGGNPSDGSSESPADDLFHELSESTPEWEQHVPTLPPRCRYAGARNVATVKDVNFLGPDDQWVVSGSDDGNFFVWEKDSAVLKGIYEGDSSVVNVIEGHPHFPLVAVSGIDTTVKLFSPTKFQSSFSRMDNADQIIQRNNSMGRVRVETYDIAALLAEARNAMGAEGVLLPECNGQ